jgi:hydroxymethylpyrimidine/phosphomethylpyrimidine kinase
MKKKKSYHKVLTIAGSDSGGGAGIQADIKTFSALGCYGMSVITALTAQNTQGVTGIFPVPPDFVKKQIEAVLSDIGADAVKIGMLFSADLITVVAAMLKKYRPSNIVLDPVITAQSGDKLLQDGAAETMIADLFPLADIVTPNLPETEALLGRKLNDMDSLREAAAAIALSGCGNVLIKGGHCQSMKSMDLLYMSGEDRTVLLAENRIQTKNSHGTGCALSSAIASFLAKGYDMEAAVKNAKAYITSAIRHGARFILGKGNGPVHHFFKFWR